MSFQFSRLLSIVVAATVVVVVGVGVIVPQVLVTRSFRRLETILAPALSVLPADEGSGMVRQTAPNLIHILVVVFFSSKFIFSFSFSSFHFQQDCLQQLSRKFGAISAAPIAAFSAFTGWGPFQIKRHKLEKILKTTKTRTIFSIFFGIGSV